MEGGGRGYWRERGGVGGNSPQPRRVHLCKPSFLCCLFFLCVWFSEERTILCERSACCEDRWSRARLKKTRRGDERGGVHRRARRGRRVISCGREKVVHLDVCAPLFVCFFFRLALLFLFLSLSLNLPIIKKTAKSSFGGHKKRIASQLSILPRIHKKSLGKSAGAADKKRCVPTTTPTPHRAPHHR